MINRISKALGIPVEDLTGNRRFRSLFFARMITAKYLRDKGFPLAKIGSILNRDHSTVLYMLQNYERDSKNDPKMREMIKDFNREMYPKKHDSINSITVEFTDDSGNNNLFKFDNKNKVLTHFKNDAVVEQITDDEAVKKIKSLIF